MADTTPWQYRMSEEDWKNLSPMAAVRHIAEALTGGVSAYQKAKQETEIEKLKTAPKQLYKLTPEGEIKMLGQVPQGAVEAKIPETTKTIWRWNEEKKEYEAVGTTGLKDVIKESTKPNPQELTADDIASAHNLADKIKKGMPYNQVVDRMPKFGTKGIKLFNIMTDDLMASGIDTGDLERAWKTEVSAMSRQTIGYVQSALKTLDRLDGFVDTAGTDVKKLNDLILKGQMQFGSVPVVSLNSLRSAIVEETGKGLMGGQSLTDDALALAGTFIDTAYSPEQMKEAIKQLKFILTQRMDTMYEMGKGERYKYQEGQKPTGQPSVKQKYDLE